MTGDIIPRIAALLVACALLLVMATKEHPQRRLHIRFEVEYGNRLD